MFKLNTESSTERIGDRKRFPGITIAGFSMHSSYIFSTENKGGMFINIA